MGNPTHHRLCRLDGKCLGNVNKKIANGQVPESKLFQEYSTVLHEKIRPNGQVPKSKLFQEYSTVLHEKMSLLRLLPC